MTKRIVVCTLRGVDVRALGGTDVQLIERLDVDWCDEEIDFLFHSVYVHAPRLTQNTGNCQTRGQKTHAQRVPQRARYL